MSAYKMGGGLQGPTSADTQKRRVSRRLLARLGPSADTCQRQFAAQEQPKQQSDAGVGQWLLIHKHDFHSRAKSALTPTGEEEGKEEKKINATKMYSTVIFFY